MVTLMPRKNEVDLRFTFSKVDTTFFDCTFHRSANLPGARVSPLNRTNLINS
jgi:hypothetical protein